MLEPLEEYQLPVNKAGLVVGGGLAGMTCALSVANQGFEVYLVEKEKTLAAEFSYYFPEGSYDKEIDQVIQQFK